MKTLLLSIIFCTCTLGATEPYRVASVDDAKAIPAGTTQVSCDQKIDDAVLKALAEVDSIEAVDLYHCRNITTAGIDALRRLKNLKRLNLDMCRQLGDGVLLVIASMTSLEDLNLNNGSKFTNEGMVHLAKLVNLRALNVGTFWAADSRGLQHVLKLPKLEELTLRLNSWVTDDVLKQVAEGKPTLTKLDLRGCNAYTAKGVAHIATLKHLRSLDMGANNTLRAEAADHIAKMEKLEHLALGQNMFFKDADLCKLASCRNLKSLWLETMLEVTGECFATWKPEKLVRLEMKNIFGMTAAGVAAICSLSNLTELHLWIPFADDITAESLAPLRQLKKLEVLDLWCPAANDDTLKGVSSLGKLQRLILTGARDVTDEGALSLAGLKSLKILSIMSCDGIGNATLDELRKQLPECQVIREKPPY